MSTLPLFNDTLGALLIGFGVSTMLYGMFLVQSLNYYRRYPKDKTVYKVIVALLLLLETEHQAFVGHSVYYYSVTNFLNILALVGKPVWSLVFQLLIGALVGFVVKFLFALRVWRFSYGNVWLTGFLLLLSFCQMGLAITYTVKSYALPALPDLASLRVIGIVALVIGVLNDIGIAISLCYYLQSMRSSFSESNSLIRSLTLYSISTGILTSAMSFTTLIIYHFMPENLIFVGCYFVLSKLYAVSFVAALNTRQTVGERFTDDEPKNKHSPLQRATDQRSRSLGIPLQTTEVMGDSLDIEFHAGEENVVSAPTSASEHLEFTQKQEKPHSVGVGL